MRRGEKELHISTFFWFHTIKFCVHLKLTPNPCKKQQIVWFGNTNFAVYLEIDDFLGIGGEIPYVTIQLLEKSAGKRYFFNDFRCGEKLIRRNITNVEIYSGAH